MNLNDPLIQVIVSLIILVLMGYFAYNIYLIEFEKMLKGSNSIRKESVVFKGIYEFGSSNEAKYETNDKTMGNYIDINPSINQEGGAEYSYNFWIYIDKEKLNTSYGNIVLSKRKDIVLFLKGTKNMYSSSSSYNCSGRDDSPEYPYNILIKNPLVRLRNDGSSIVIEYNNIYTPDSFKDRTSYIDCMKYTKDADWYEKNKNLIGVYNLDFNKKWFMVSIILKEVADSNNILLKNRASCKMYINGVNVLDRKVETKFYNTTYSATFKNNKSPLYVNPSFTDINNPSQYFGNSLLQNDAVKIADLKYYNYSLTEKEILQLYRNGFSKYPAVVIKSEEARYNMVSSKEMEINQIRQI